MSTTITKYYKNKLTEPLLRHKILVRENKLAGTFKESDLNKFKINVFGTNHEQVAEDLYEALNSSGFLDKYALFSIDISPIQ